MKAKRLIILMAIAVGIFVVAGCSCMSWTNFWGGDPDAECVSHWEWKQKEVEVAGGPCDAPAKIRSEQSYPIGAGGNAIRLEKMSPKEVGANADFEYRIKVTNLTDQKLHNVVVRDVLSEAMEIKSSVPETWMIEEEEISWRFSELGAKASEMITVSAVSGGEGFVRSCADVSYDSPTCAQIAIVEPKLQLSKIAPTEVLLCDRIPLKYVVTNKGTGYSCDLQIKERLPESLKTAKGERELIFSVDSLGPGESREFTKTIDVSKAGRYAGRAMVSFRGGGRVESNLTTTIVRQPVLTVNESCPASKYIGRSLTYDITVSNKGDGMAKNTVIEASVPEGVEFDRASDGGQFSHASPGKVTWNIGELAPNISKVVSMKVRTNMAGPLVSTAMAKAYCAETVSDICRTNLSGIPATLLEVIDISDPVVVGQTTSYVISVTNQGSALITNVRITCVLEENMRYVSSSGQTLGSFSRGEVAFAPLSSLAPKAQAKWKVNIKALEEGDSRFKVMMTNDQLGRLVQETESTMFYE